MNPTDGLLGSREADLTVLFVCTGNICRSPLAERLGRAQLAGALGPVHGVQLVSAGTRAAVGRGMDPASARVLQHLGGDPAGFRARQLTGPMVGAADLTLTMTRRHREDVLARAPRGLARTFTLREAAGLLELVSAETPAGETPAHRARALVQQMAAARAGRPSRLDDDVLDPVGRPDEVHQQVGQVIAESVDPVLRRLLAALAGRVPEHR